MYHYSCCQAHIVRTTTYFVQPPTMERSPPEILCFSPLCNDGGPFGISLSLVSCYHDASTRVRFQSVRCCGTTGIICLLALQNMLPPELRIIRHLYAYPTRMPPPLIVSPRPRARCWSMRRLALFTNTSTPHPPPPLPKEENIQRNPTRTLPGPHLAHRNRRSTYPHTISLPRTHHILARPPVFPILPQSRRAFHQPRILRQLLTL